MGIKYQAIALVEHKGFLFYQGRNSNFSVAIR